MHPSMRPSLLQLRPAASALRRAAAKRCSSTLAPRSIAALLKRSAEGTAGAEIQSLTLNGFVRSVRKQKRVAFAAVGDGSSLQTVQVVLNPEQASG